MGNTSYASDENRFVQALVDDDVAAWREFQARHARGIERSISGVTAQFSALVGADDVREIFAMVCLRLIEHDKRKLRSFDATRGHSFKSWLSMVARQTSFDYLRRRRRQLGRDLDAGLELVATAAPPDPYEECWTTERSRLVTSLLEQLSARDREFLQLFLQDRLPDEIASAMGISLPTVYSKRHKISAQLSRLARTHELAA